MKLNGENYVAQHNKLIEHKGGMTLLEQKIFRAIISEIRINDDHTTQYEIPLQNLNELMGLKSNSIYDDLREAFRKIMRRTIEIESMSDEGKRGYYMTHIISSAMYYDDDSYFTVTIDPILRPYLFELTSHFTQYQLKYVMKMSSVYTIRIYEIVKSKKIKQSNYEFEIELVELKKMLAIGNEYNRMYDFEKYVLKTACEEINQQTEIMVDYKKVYRNNKKGKGVPIDKIQFIVNAKDSFKAQYIECIGDYYSLNDLKIRSGLEKESFNIEQMITLYEIAVDASSGLIDPFEYIKLTNQYVATKGIIRSKYKYLQKALTEDYGKIVQMAQIERMMKDRSELNKE